MDGPIGSPPLVRERPRNWIDCKINAGITPARAGKTIDFRGRCCILEDHPRSCGKDAMAEYKKQVLTGSPPLVRERQNKMDRACCQARITPARAGKTAGPKDGAY